jgi:hypothetical protein
MLQSAFVENRMMLRTFFLEKTYLRLIAGLGLLFVLAVPVRSQTPRPAPTPAAPTPANPDVASDEKKVEAAVSAAKISSGNLSAEQVAELVIAIYGFPNGRTTLNHIRKTAAERGKVTVTNAAGKSETATYQRWFLRGADEIEKTRIDQQFPNVRFSLVFDGNELFTVFNESSFIPNEDAAQAFRDKLFHSIDALLRYKESGAELVLGGREKILGVEYHLVDMTDKLGRRTRYYVSVKSFRVMMLDYTSAGVDYRRKFYDYNYAQGTLYPFQSVLSSGDKVLEEQEVGTITFGQKVDDGLFGKP